MSTISLLPVDTWPPSPSCPSAPGPIPSSTPWATTPGPPTSSRSGSASWARPPPGCSAGWRPASTSPRRLRPRPGRHRRRPSAWGPRAVATRRSCGPSARCCQFDLAMARADGTLAVRRKVPPLNRRQVLRLPPSLVAAHQAWQEGELRTPAAEQQRRRARRLALSLLELGEDVDATERQLLRWKFHPGLCRESAAWAWDRHRRATADDDARPRRRLTWPRPADAPPESPHSPAAGDPRPRPPARATSTGARDGGGGTPSQQTGLHQLQIGPRVSK